ncbi:MAG TPA: mannosyltransferase family protein [Polyangiaceae bacterium]|jgi:hypothetical protein|nr:mannosyltransferase family protein [Polyangiaceae bacterium]
MSIETRSEVPVTPAFTSSLRVRSLVRVLLHVVWTRAVLWGVVDYAVHTRHPRFHPSALREFGESTLSGVLRWDAWWYVSVVQDGYVFDAHHASNVAFLPGFPALIALATPLFGSAALAGFWLSNAALVAAVVVLWSWVDARAGLAAAERASVLLLLYPFSFFLDAGYSESVYFLWCALALRAADREEPARVALFASLATLTRPMGILLAVASAWGLFRSRRARFVDLLPLCAPPVALGAFAVYLWVTQGSPFALVTAQRIGWGVGAAMGVPGWHDELFRQFVDAFRAFLPVPLLYAAWKASRRLGPVAGAYAIMTTLMAISLGQDSVGREVLAVVPLFALLGLWRPGSKTELTLRAASFALLSVFTYAFALGHFVG